MALTPEQIAYGLSMHAARKKLGTVIDEKTASLLESESFGGMDYDGDLIRAGTIIQWRGAKKKAAVDLWDREDNNPDNAPTLWDDIEYHDGVRVIPDVYTVGKQFDQWEEGWWHGSDAAPMGVYVSQIPANVTHPGDERWWKPKEIEQPEGQEDGGTTEPTGIAPAWDSFPVNHPFSVGDRFSDGGINYLVQRAFTRLDHFRPPALLGDYYVIDQG